MTESRYEELYDQLYIKAVQVHDANKKRLQRGFIAILVLPFVLALIRFITGSDKTFFLIIWVLLMFGISALLIFVEYLDYQIQSTLNELSEKEAEFDDLISMPSIAEGGIIQSRVRDRLRELQNIRAANMDEAIAAAEAAAAKSEKPRDDAEAPVEAAQEGAGRR